MNKQPKTLSPSEARIVLQQIVAAKDKDGLWNFIDQFLGIEIPRNQVCADHCAPFDFISDYIFGEVNFAIVMANRSGGKTENFAILDTLLSFLYDDTEVATVGAIQFQAQKCYEYFKEFSSLHPFADNIYSPTMKKTTCVNGSSVQVITGTMSGVNSPHPQLLFVDEIDLMAWQVLQQALSMPQSKAGVESRTVLTSTRKFAGGVMQRLIDDSGEKGYKVYSWCIWEVIEKLPTEPAKIGEIYNTFKGELPDNIAQADGYYSWRDAMAKKNSPLEAETWEVEWLCRKPGLSGVIYGSSYSDDNNLITDWSPQGLGGHIYLFEDFGFGEGHPDVVLPVWIPVAFDRLVVFDELYMTSYGTQDIWQAIDGMLQNYGLRLPAPRQNIRGNLRGWIGDPHGFTEIADRKQLGAPMMEKAEDPELYLVNNGITLVKKFMAAGKILITNKCINLRMELLSYKRKKNADGTYSMIPEKKNDHGPDALRYGLIKLHGLLEREMFAKLSDVRTTDIKPSTFVKNTGKSDGKPLTSGFLTEKF
jgi:hypothetical protein